MLSKGGGWIHLHNMPSRHPGQASEKSGIPPPRGIGLIFRYQNVISAA